MGNYLTHSPCPVTDSNFHAVFHLSPLLAKHSCSMQPVESENKSRLKLSRQSICFNLDQLPNLILYTAAKTLLQTLERKQWGERGGWRDHFFFPAKPWNNYQITAIKDNSWSPSCSTDSRIGVLEDLPQSKNANGMLLKYRFQCMTSIAVKKPSCFAVEKQLKSLFLVN